MRRVSLLAIALLAAAPIAVRAADPMPQGLSQMVAAYERVQAVRVVERFENGSSATVDVMPSGQYRIAASGGQDPALIVKVATQPADGAVTTGTYIVTNLGTKTIDAAKCTGFKIVAPDGTYTSTVWVNEHHLPVQAHVETQGHKIDVVYGDYNSSAMVATPK